MKSLELFVIGVQSNISRLMHLIFKYISRVSYLLFCFWETSMAFHYFTLYIKFEGWGEKGKKFSQLLKMHNLLTPKWSEYLVYKYSRDPNHLAAEFHLFDLSPVFVWCDKTVPCPASDSPGYTGAGEEGVLHLYTITSDSGAKGTQKQQFLN